MSLAGCELKLSEIMEHLAKKWDTMAEGLDEVSLAGFQLQLSDIMKKVSEKLGGVGKKPPPVTGRLNSSTIGNHSAMQPSAGPGCHWPAVPDPAGGVT